MSERALAVLAVISSLAVVPLTAQSTAQLEARVRRLEAKEKVLQDSVELIERERFERYPRRYFTVAGITFGVPVEVADAAEQALKGDEAAWRARYGSALALLANDTLSFLVDAPTGTDDPSFTVSWRFADQRGETNILSDEELILRWVTTVPASVLRRWETSLLGPPMREWLKGAAPPLGSVGDDRLARSDLLFSRSGPARRCLEGSMRDCERALALKEGADPYTEWYDPADLAAMARDASYGRAPGRASCAATGELEACRSAFGGNTERLLPPTRTEVRGSLYLYAIQAGGSEALARLHADSTRSPARQLEVASGMSIDSLVAGWHSALVSQRPGTGPDGGVFALTVALLWSVVLLALFAWRFRWHHV